MWDPFRLTQSFSTCNNYLLSHIIHKNVEVRPFSVISTTRVDWLMERSSIEELEQYSMVRVSREADFRTKGQAISSESTY